MPTPLASPPPNTAPPNGHAHPAQNARHIMIVTPPTEAQRPKASQIPIREDGARNLLRKHSAPAAPPSQSGGGGVLSFLFGSGKPRHKSVSVREPGPRHQSMQEPPRGRDMREVRHPREVQVNWAPDANINVRKVVAMNPAREDLSHMRKLSKRR
ncbi:hypothetical protein EWM64_g5678 [Hericium alpestre]|uniref:Uncharacterized protein n=1 Tax=Hericium alpestre TaxID=135208 RepID=A0A4Y9ZWA3_9AGAM|nr:hypothetical protein EWM64_g5678 [Hericium alpestre]